MEKVYRLLDFLDANQAVDWLQRITKCQLSGGDLIRLCNSGHCNIYVDCSGVEIKEKGEARRELCSKDAKVCSHVEWSCSMEGDIYLSGKFTVESKSYYWESSKSLLPDVDFTTSYAIRGRITPRFKPNEIEALAAKIAGESPYIANAVNSELEDLRQQLEQERAAREAAEQAQVNTKPSHLLAIAALLDLLKAPVDRPRPQGMNQEAVKAAILEQFPWRGLSDRNLQEIFARANEAKEDAK